jgi:hypothetical protein
MTGSATVAALKSNEMKPNYQYRDERGNSTAHGKHAAAPPFPPSLSPSVEREQKTNPEVGVCVHVSRVTTPAQHNLIVSSYLPYTPGFLREASGVVLSSRCLAPP